MVGRLVSCEDCGRQISLRASACPHCGCPAPRTTPTSTIPVSATPGPGGRRKSATAAFWTIAATLTGVVAFAVYDSTSSKNTKTEPVFDRDLEATPEHRRANCKRWSPKACALLLRCQPGLNPMTLPTAFADASTVLTKIRDGAAQEACEKAMDADECNESSYGWGDETALNSCLSYSYCECAQRNTTFCYPRGFHSQDSNRPRSDCPSIRLPIAHDYLDLLPDLRSALAFAFSYRSGGLDEENPATSLFLSWAVSKLRWVDIANSTTSPAKVFKDSTGEYGRAYCATGHIVQLTKMGVYYKVIVAVRGDVVRLYAVGDTAELVQGMNAGFCGIVTGTSTYSNTGGGTTHAIDVVGMFALATNKGSMVAPRSEEPRSEMKETRPSRAKKTNTQTNDVSDVPDTSTLPISLDRSMISRGIAAIKAKAVQCGINSEVHGRVKLNVQVGPSGDVVSVVVVESPDDELGACVAGAMRNATFSRTQNGGSFSYPFVF